MQFSFLFEVYAYLHIIQDVPQYGKHLLPFLGHEAISTNGQGLVTLAAYSVDLVVDVPIDYSCTTPRLVSKS